MLKNIHIIVLGLSLLTACGKAPSGATDKASSTPSATPASSASGGPATTESSPSPSGDATKKNLLALGNGAFVVSQTSQWDSGWRSLNLVDELPKVGWASDKTQVTNQSAVIELPSKTTLKSLSFFTANVDEEGVAAKDVVVEVSEASPTSGFSQILAATLKDKTDGQEFETSQAVAGRWVRVTVKNNYGSPNFIELMDVKGYGEQEPITPPGNVSGTYETDFGLFHIKNEGTTVVGCYEFNDGRLEGGIDNRVMTLNWREDGEKSKGPAIMIFPADGKSFLGAWSHTDATGGFGGTWNGKKVSDKIGNCPHYADLDKDKAAQNSIAKSLNDNGRAVVYGINFDFNSDVIKSESRSTLDKIAAVLNESKDMKMTIEGHTDNVGGESFNLSLSEKRAKSVKAYLTSQGIDEARLSTRGAGMTKPVSTNDTEAGRAQNRRVELVKN